MAHSASYEIKLPQFEGPFDLLLFFIERDELDIYDIPIKKITDDFLDYLHQAEALNIELASEFILVAATLMRIKAKMLLPRKERDEQGNEIDPRQELVQRLVEYKQFKEVVEELTRMEEERMKLFSRGNIQRDLIRLSELSEGDAELHSLTLFKLFNAFSSVLKRYEQQEKVKHTVIKYPYTIEETKTNLIGRLKKEAYESFENIFRTCESRIHAIFTFLAMLELIQQNLIELKLGEGINNFWVKLA
ncbi:MAG: segregation and condensation protein A [Chitinophagales bacterium]|nr:MAG: segregation and condensation protein A [Chitinophagales bacterium]